MSPEYHSIYIGGTLRIEVSNLDSKTRKKVVHKNPLNVTFNFLFKKVSIHKISIQMNQLERIIHLWSHGVLEFFGVM